ncbi:MAG TPA: type II toxin-antitoxin system VapC family toxin [Ktedonobacterales bacterium]
MAAYFFDSSAIAKRYHWEPGSAWIRAVCSPRQHHRLYLSRLAHVEVVAGLRRTGRFEGMHPAAIDAMVNTFERQLALSIPDRPTSIYHLLPVSVAVLKLAAALKLAAQNIRFVALTRSNLPAPSQRCPLWPMS